MLAVWGFLRGAIFGGPRIPIPIGALVLLVALVSAYWNVTWVAKAREQVRAAVAEIVADVEITALKTEIEAQKLRADDLDKTIKAKDQIIAIRDEALAEFRERAETSEQEVAEKDAEIDALLANRPEGSEGCNCAAPADIFNRLRDQ